MSGMRTRQQERESLKYERVTAALTTCALTEKYQANFLRHGMDDDRLQKCLEDFEKMDLFQSFIIRNVEHQKDFIIEFKKTKSRGSEDEQESLPAQPIKTPSGRLQQPPVYVNANLSKIKMEVDYVPVKAEPEDVENYDVEEPEVANSLNQMSKLNLSQSPHVCLIPGLEEVKMQVDDVVIKEEPQEAENDSDGEPEMDKSSIHVSKPEDIGIGIAESKNKVDDSRPGPSSAKPTGQLPSNQERVSSTGKAEVLPLPKLTDAESLEFILKELEIPESDTPQFKKESRELVELIDGTPLALEQAVAVIKQEASRKFVGKSYQISDYVKEMKLNMKYFGHLPQHLNLSLSPTVCATWNVVFDKLQKSVNRESATKILEILYFLNAEVIPSSFLRTLVPEITDTEFSASIVLLEKYSLVKLNVQDFSLNLHPQREFLLFRYISEIDYPDVTKLLMSIVEKCGGVLEILEKMKLSESTSENLNVPPFDFVPLAKNILDFLSGFAHELSNASRYSEALEVCSKVYRKSRELLGENHEDTLRSQSNIAQQLEHFGKHDEALALYKETLKKMQNHPDLGVCHPHTIATKHNMASVLKEQEKYQEALEMYQQVLAQQNKIHGENNPESLITQHQIALIYLELKRFPEALTLFEQVEKKQIEILGPDHKDILSTKHNIALTLHDMGRFPEALKMFKEVYEKCKDKLGEDHLSTIGNVEWIAKILAQEKKYKEAFDLMKKVYEFRKARLGEDHPHTVATKSGVLHIGSKLWPRRVHDIPQREWERRVLM